MVENYKAVLPESSIGQALFYSLQRWDKLSLYRTHGKLKIDNNLAGNSKGPLTIGRKNYLFAGSHNGAQREAMLYPMLGTCELNRPNPFRLALESPCLRAATDRESMQQTFRNKS